VSPAPAGGPAGSPGPADTELDDPVINDGVTRATPIEIPDDIGPPVRDSVYDPAKDRQDMRKWLGIGILGTTGAIALIAALAILAGSTDSQNLPTGVFTPLVGLSGAVIGFYFGGKDPRA